MGAARLLVYPLLCWEVGGILGATRPDLLFLVMQARLSPQAPNLESFGRFVGALNEWDRQLDGRLGAADGKDVDPFLLFRSGRGM